MPRPKRLRRIMNRPDIRRFGPYDTSPSKEIALTLEEYEAIRLIDYDGMDQSQAAEVMEVSRQTVGRILRAGRTKVAAAIVEGQHLKVGGGCYRVQGQGKRPGQGPCPGAGRGRGRGGCGRGRGKGFQNHFTRPDDTGKQGSD